MRGLLKIIPIGAAVFGAGLIAFGFSRSLWLSLPMMFVTGFGMMQGVTTSNTILQTLVDEKMRGRVMSYYTMAFVGMAPFGSLLAGAMAHAIGAPRTVIVSGIACIAGALWFWTRMPAIRARDAAHLSSGSALCRCSQLHRREPAGRWALKRNRRFCRVHEFMAQPGARFKMIRSLRMIAEWDGTKIWSALRSRSANWCCRGWMRSGVGPGLATCGRWRMSAASPW